jgi:ActR/RegA family two-component response regulator
MSAFDENQPLAHGEPNQVSQGPLLPRSQPFPLVDAEVDTAPPPATRLLLVDDDETLLHTLKLVLQRRGFDVVAATSVNEALKLIGSQTFDVLLSDLHIPQAGDGLTVVSAMRNVNPKAITLIFSAYPEMKQATEALLRQADEILVKPLGVELLVKTIREHLTKGARPLPDPVMDVASVLEHETQSAIKDWLRAIHLDPQKVLVPLSDDVRTAHLPHLFRDLVYRLRTPLPLGTRALVSPAAAQHGLLRRQQGYTAAMLVEESRMLQVSIFQTLQNNLSKIDFSRLLIGVMSIADEVDSQLAQQMAAYISESKAEAVFNANFEGDANSDTLPITA